MRNLLRRIDIVFVAMILTAGPAWGALPGGSLNPNDIPKYEDPLVIPPVMPPSPGNPDAPEKNTVYYEIAVRQFEQQILPPADIHGNPLNPTTVWSYGSVSHPGTVAEGGTFHYPALTIEAKWNQPIRIKWINDLIDENGDFLPHLLPVDPTLHWANPIGTRDQAPPRNPEDAYWSHPYIDQDTGQYIGPVPIVTHVHGAETYEDSDGYPEAWYLPAGVSGVEWKTGTFYDHFKANSPLGSDWSEGSAVFRYPNTQRPATLWYHDHSLGMTRLNVYAGPAGFYLLRGGPGDAVRGKLPGPAPKRGNAHGLRYYEIPIVIQDRSFNDDGSLFYPAFRAFFEEVDPEELQIPFIPEETINELPSDVAPIWNPEFFGNTMVVNGKTWPRLDVEQRRYRLRLLNGAQSRFLILKFNHPDVEIWQIGADGGFLPAPVDINSQSHGELLLGPAERADVIVDFTNVPVGTEIILLNLAPDEPFGGGRPGIDFEPADPDTTGQVMQFVVQPRRGADPSTPPDRLVLPSRTPLPVETAVRYLSLNEEESESVCVLADAETDEFLVPITEVDCFGDAPEGMEIVPFGPVAALLGTLDNPAILTRTPLPWGAEITENPQVGTTEIWEIWNFTMDAHPIHVHLVQFEILGREPFDPMIGTTSISGTNAPLPGETGTKDTIIVYPGEKAIIKAHFSLPGLFVWHCHILEHEDNEMMRPYCVTNEDGSRPASCETADAGGMRVDDP
jgi:spore coat protein A, manganese oxidase